MARTFKRIFKCRNCGQLIITNVRLTYSAEWMLTDIFKNNDDYVPVVQGSQLSQSVEMFHRYDPENLCICDFIGWRPCNDAKL